MNPDNAEVGHDPLDKRLPFLCHVTAKPDNMNDVCMWALTKWACVAFAEPEIRSDRSVPGGTLLHHAEQPEVSWYQSAARTICEDAIDLV